MIRHDDIPSNVFRFLCIILLVFVILFSAVPSMSAQEETGVWWKICKTEYGCLLRVDGTGVVMYVQYENGYPAGHPVSVTPIDGTWVWMWNAASFE